MRVFLLWVVLFALTSQVGAVQISRCVATGGGGGGSATLILSDDFERANSTNLGANWIEQRGDLEINDGYVRGATTSTQHRYLLLHEGLLQLPLPREFGLGGLMKTIIQRYYSNLGPELLDIKNGQVDHPLLM